MTPSVSDKIEIVLKHAQPAIRDELSRHLHGCRFADPDDPILNSLLAQSMIAGQPVRLAEAGGSAVATEDGLARLGDRVEASAWSLARAKIQTIVLGWLLAAMIGGGGVLMVIKLRPSMVAGWCDIPRVEDDRLRALDSVGATLHVEPTKGKLYVWLSGSAIIRSGESRDGVRYLYIEP